MTTNIDTVLAMFDAVSRRDIDAALQHADPDVELRPAIQGLDVKNLYRGRAEVKQFFATIMDAWDEYAVELEEATEISPDQVLVVEHWHTRGRQGIQFDFQLTEIYTFRDGLLVLLDGFVDKASALAAAGLGSG